MMKSPEMISKNSKSGADQKTVKIALVQNLDSRLFRRFWSDSDLLSFRKSGPRSGAKYSRPRMRTLNWTKSKSEPRCRRNGPNNCPNHGPNKISDQKFGGYQIKPDRRWTKRDQPDQTRTSTNGALSDFVRMYFGTERRMSLKIFESKNFKFFE